ncbi:MAG: hypothetical protein ACP5C3_00755 [Methanomicrobiales archaeon]
MLELIELNVLRAIGDDIKKRDDLTRSYECSNFKFNPCTALDVETSIIGALTNFESSHLIKIDSKEQNLDSFHIKMTRQGFYEYLKYSGGVLEIFKPVGKEIKNGNKHCTEISHKTGLKKVVVYTILEEWAAADIINISKKDKLEITKTTPHGDNFIEALLSV